MTILVHLNVEKDPADGRTASEIADALLAELGVGEQWVEPRRDGLRIVCPLAEEVEV